MLEIKNIKNRKGLNMAVRVNWSPERDKCVFLEHGIGARKEYPHMLVMEEVFAEHGYNVINFDATNSLNASDSSEEGITFTGHYEDLEDVINWAKTQEIYKEPFSLAGQSLGAQAIVLFASKYPDKVNLLVPCAFPWLDGKIEYHQNKRTKEILEKGYYDQVSKSTGRVLRINRNYIDDLLKYYFNDLVKNVKSKTYVICGLKDSEYHIENCKKLYDLLNCEKEIHLLPEVPHDLANTPETKALFTETLNAVLDKNLCKERQD